VALPRRTGSNYDVAVVLRSENLESRLHASVTFVKKSGLRDMSFKIGVVGQDLLCRDEEDVHIPAYQFYRRKMAFRSYARINIMYILWLAGFILTCFTTIPAALGGG
jgi:hypothetical protein